MAAVSTEINLMKRIVISIILGLILPIVFFVGIGFSTDYMTPSYLTDIKIFGQNAPGILLAPFSLPIYLDIFLKEKRIAPFIFDTLLFRISSLILFNWIIYGFLMYWILGKFSRFRQQKQQYSETPPLPTEFENLK